MNSMITIRTIEPIISAIVDAMKSKFLTKSARTKGQSIMYFTDPFKLTPTTALADLGDKLIRNEILTKNEFRQIIGFKPSSDEGADRLSNPNLYQNPQGVPGTGTSEAPPAGTTDPEAPEIEYV